MEDLNLCWAIIKLLFGQISEIPIVFLPRHGRGHRLSPSSINYRANIDALKRSGVTDIISLSAVGSLKEEYQPGHFVLIDQFIDRTLLERRRFLSRDVLHMFLLRSQYLVV